MMLAATLCAATLMFAIWYVVHRPIRRALERSVEWFEDRFGYLRFVDNWHKARPISWLMCKLGRHDYEAERVHVWLRATDLYCVYCEHRKRSYHVNEGRGIE